MSIPSTAYRALIFGYLLAAGCGEVAYEEFVAEQSELECEIQSMCGVEVPASCSGPIGNEVLDDCHWFRPVHGQQCLDAMVATLELVSDDPASCGEWSLGNPLTACDFEDVTRRRRSLGCFFGKLGSGRPIRDHGVVVVAPILRVAPSSPRTAPVHARPPAGARPPSTSTRRSPASSARLQSWPRWGLLASSCAAAMTPRATRPDTPRRRSRSLQPWMALHFASARCRRSTQRRGRCGSSPSRR